MFDYVIAKINALIALASGVVNQAAGQVSTTWDDVVAHFQGAYDALIIAYENHMLIQSDAENSGLGAQWNSLRADMENRIADMRALANGINAFKANTITGPGLNGLGIVWTAPIIAGVTVLGALTLIGVAYTLASTAADFYLTVTGKKPPSTGGPFTNIVLGVATIAALAYAVPKMLERRL